MGWERQFYQVEEHRFGSHLESPELTSSHARVTWSHPESPVQTPRVSQSHLETPGLTWRHLESPAESPGVTRSHLESSRITWSHLQRHLE